MPMQVDPQHVHYELSAAKFSWDHPKGEPHSSSHWQTCTCSCHGITHEQEQRVYCSFADNVCASAEECSFAPGC
jgi:hypothetical protein